MNSCVRSVSDSYIPIQHLHIRLQMRNFFLRVVVYNTMATCLSPTLAPKRSVKVT